MVASIYKPFDLDYCRMIGFASVGFNAEQGKTNV